MSQRDELDGEVVFAVGAFCSLRQTLSFSRSITKTGVRNYYIILRT
jgi:hypothetical protein